jgi:Pyruvate/2-oxoacid:ferredoxin oxidoreductase delta subunit
MVRILLKFSEEIIEKPITAQVILEHKVPISIVAAHTDSQGGEILVEVPSTHAERLIDAFRKRGVTVTVPKLIEIDSEKCFDCGACLSLCPVSAISLKEDFSVAFDDKKCIGSPCGMCVDACPARAIKLVEQHSSGSK